MKTGRDKKIAEELRREISQIFSFELGDPRLTGVTVTGVRMTPDLKTARVYYALPLHPDGAEGAQTALKKSSSWIRRKVATRITIKYMPKLEFFYDESLEIEDRLDKIFDQLSRGTQNSNSEEHNE